MIDPLLHQKSYTDATKYRCVDRATLYPDITREAAQLAYFSGPLFGDGTAFKLYWKSRRGPVGQAKDERAISDNLNYWFSKAFPPYSAGRFNTAAFPALYTAKEIETAQEERFHYLKASTKPFDWAVYSILVTSHVADLRPQAADGSFVIEEDHVPCRTIAETLRTKVGGVAWPSKRFAGGSCCAMFSVDGVKPGVLAAVGTQAPPPS